MRDVRMDRERADEHEGGEGGGQRGKAFWFGGGMQR